MMSIGTPQCGQTKVDCSPVAAALSAVSTRGATCSSSRARASARPCDARRGVADVALYYLLLLPDRGCPGILPVCGQGIVATAGQWAARKALNNFATHDIDDIGNWCLQNDASRDRSIPTKLRIAGLS